MLLLDVKLQSLKIVESLLAVLELGIKIPRSMDDRSVDSRSRLGRHPRYAVLVARNRIRSVPIAVSAYDLHRFH